MNWFKTLFLNKNEKKFIEHNKNIWKEVDNSKNGEILVDLFPVNQSILIYSYLVNIASNIYSSEIVSFTQAITIRQFVLNSILLSKTRIIYKSFNCKRNINVRSFRQTRKKAIKEVRLQLKKISEKKDVVNITIDKIRIGDLIYDSYLRSYNCPTIDLKSKKFRRILVQAFCTYYFWIEYFKSKKIHAVILSHEVYIQFGILSRICNEAQIPVFIGNKYYLSRLTKKNFLIDSVVNYYPELYGRLSPQKKSQGLLKAKELLGRRLSGEVAVNMDYQTISAYHSEVKERLLSDSDCCKVLIATHCFFDNPHSYEYMLFPDFYEWLCFLGNKSEETDYEWYLKTHPDYLPGTMEVINSILKRYPKLKLLPADASHHQLIKEGISCVLTVHGSIAHEYAYFGLPVINAGHNPHIRYNFNININTIEEYNNILHDLGNVKLKIDREEIYEFYFTHYILSINKDWFYSDSFSRKFISLDDFSSSRIYSEFIKSEYENIHEKLLLDIKSFILSDKIRLLK